MTCPKAGHRQTNFWFRSPLSEATDKYFERNSAYAKIPPPINSIELK